MGAVHRPRRSAPGRSRRKRAPRANRSPYGSSTKRRRSGRNAPRPRSAATHPAVKLGECCLTRDALWARPAQMPRAVVAWLAMALSASNHRVLRALGETLLPSTGPGDPSGGEVVPAAVEELLSAMTPADTRRVGSLLTLFDLAALPRFLRPFS